MTARHEQMTARLMARYGGAATLTRIAPGEGGTPWAPAPETVAAHAVQIIETGHELDLQEGSVIQAGDLVAVMLPHADVTPAPVDRLTIGAAVFTLLSVRPVRSDPEGPPIHFVLHGRQ